MSDYQHVCSGPGKECIYVNTHPVHEHKWYVIHIVDDNCEYDSFECDCGAEKVENWCQRSTK